MIEAGDIRLLFQRLEIELDGRGDSSAYRDFVTQTLSQASELSPATRAMVQADGKEDNVFVTVSGPNELLWMNYTAQEVKKTAPAPLSLPPYSIVSQKIGKRQ